MEFVDLASAISGHLIIEGLLLAAIFYLLSQKSYQPEKRPLTEKEIDQLCDDWEPEPLYPQVSADTRTEGPVLESAAKSHAIVNGKSVINLSTSNFLGLVGHERIKEACKATIEKYGVGACGPRGFYGTIDVHLDLEKRIAGFLGTPDSILYSYGLATASSTIPAFCKQGDLIIADDGVNWSIQNGLMLSRSTVKYFKHNDMASLRKILEGVKQQDQKAPKALNRRFIVVEGIYQNSGRLAPLDEILKLKEQYQFRLIVDESNTLGVIGGTGRGVSEHFNIPVEKVDIIIAAMGNALASAGGFCAGSLKVVDHQRLSGAGYCFSASLPPYVATASMAAIELLEETPDLLTKLHSNINALRNGLSSLSCLQVASHPLSPVIHLQLRNPSGKFSRDSIVLQEIANLLLRRENVLVAVTRRSSLDKCVLPATLKLAVSASHTADDIRAVTEAFSRVCDSR